MTTSGTYVYNPNVNTIINRSLRLCGAIASGETPESSEAQDALDVLNAMAKAWQASGIHVWAETEATIFLQPGQRTYQIGPGTPDAVASSWSQTTLAGNAASGATTLSLTGVTGFATGNSIGVQLASGVNYWTTISALSGTTATLTAALPSAASSGALVFTYAGTFERPLRVPAARRYQISSAIETPLIVMSRLDYAAMPNKANTGTVTQFFFDPQLSLASLSVWPTPSDNSSALKFTVQRPLQDLSILGNTMDFPQEWAAALAWNLAVEIAPEYDVPMERFEILKLQAKEHKTIVMGWDKEPESILFGMAMDASYRT